MRRPPHVVIVPVERADDPRVADYTALSAPSRRQRLEVERGLLIAEGAVTVRTLLTTPGVRARSLLVLPRAVERLRGTVPAGVPVYVAERQILRAIAGFDVHRGVLAAADRPAARDAADVLEGARRVLVLSGVGDHENVGSIFRSAAGLGADAVLLDERCADPLYRRAVRVSIGQVLRVPFARTPPLAGVVDELHAAGFETLALTPAADAEPLSACSFGTGDRVALLLGAEGPGLDDATLGAARRRVRIPLRGGVDSLNVAVAAAIALHQLTAPSS